ncbi:C-C motif chemokine 5-like [Rhinoderma darwinii]|uniref:C-C motif chemokine 5-like n=1 Tax=Rhinoderma darwinii TaxID=43563 RepID=UPI003F661F19
MAPTTLIIFLMVASMCAICQVSSANLVTSDCCLKTKNKELPYNNMKCYYRQNTAKGCNIDAVVFITRRNKYLCAPPSSPWVKTLMEKLDKNKPQFKKYCGR